ncbi:putative receptor-like protein kinase At4g00960 [Pistacia vera]|uniref:putative receptor-like protein kinase At4g00960 n=1 Tax=Pistacia vera TaxID=55513 RepID=UPI001263E3A2|nr:putative receptor-like protein kinase At4g00960 [Pistacia vera]
MACSISLSKIILSAIVMLIISAKITHQQTTDLYHHCIKYPTTFTPNIAFSTNLNQTLSSLISNATLSNGFYNASTGGPLAVSDEAYGLFLCRGDIAPDLCQSCVKAASETIITVCPKQKEAIIWYEECMLRYSNKTIFADMEENPGYSMGSMNDVVNVSQFKESLDGLMSSLIKEAVGSSKFFATKEVNLSTVTRLYGLAQCTPDIVLSECNICLDDCVSEISECCYGKEGGRVNKPSCNIRFEMYPFYSQPTPTPPPAPVPQPPPPVPSTSTSGNRQISLKRMIEITVPTVLVFTIILSTSCYCLLSWKEGRKYRAVNEGNVLSPAGDEISMVEFLQLDLHTIEAATHNFSDGNKIGEGGFGSVYKGTLHNGQEVAIKRLSRGSGQGLHEFRNEVALAAKLQHRKLVRILGFCAEKGEKILVYEFVPNKSLDYFLFDPEKQGLLNWPMRCKIIEGIARGLLYLHEDSRFRIIHCDLKASNVLLDEDMKPKIADFGIARICGMDQSRGSTSRIVGTYGYMSPEYVLHGQFSIKSDVYSFGVLVIEIISGKKNNCFYQSAYAEGLLSYAWRLWREGTPLKLMDKTLGDLFSPDEVIRCIHIGLLCVQEDPTDRPIMATILLMLNSFSTALPLPKRPAFSIHRTTEQSMPKTSPDSIQYSGKPMPSYVNDEPITELYPR